jgi:heme A synthase
MNIVPRPEVSPQRRMLGMWFRVALALSLAVTMGWWPYNRSCGFPLLGYLSAVTTVIVAGIWAAMAAWKVRSGLAHTIALILVLFGFVLAGSELLTRNGYAVDRATWQCEDPILDTTVSA